MIVTNPLGSERNQSERARIRSACTACTCTIRWYPWYWMYCNIQYFDILRIGHCNIQYFDILRIGHGNIQYSKRVCTAHCAVCVLLSLSCMVLMWSDCTALKAELFFCKFTWGRQEKEALSGFSLDESLEDNNLPAVVEGRSVREGWTLRFSINDQGTDVF